MANALFLRMLDGESLRKICDSPDMPSVAVIFKWLTDGAHPEFVEQYARTREAQGHLYADETREIVDSEPDAARARVRFDQRRWHASKLAPKVYGDKIEQRLTGANGESLPVMVYIPANGRDEGT